MILEALGILKILDWATAGDRYQHQQPARIVEPDDEYTPPYAVEGGEVRILTTWVGDQKRWCLQGRLSGCKGWTDMWWHWDGRIVSVIADFMMSPREFEEVFRKVLHDPDVLRPLKEKQ